MTTVDVQLGDRSYQVLCEYQLLDQAGERIKSAGLAGKAALISDSSVSALYAARVVEQLKSQGYQVSQHTVAAGEASKSMTNVAALCSEMTTAGHDRKSFVVALGGGVVGDLAGFVAASFYRGIPFVQIPTTIVSLVDR